MRIGNGVYKDPRTSRFVARVVDAYGKRKSRVFDRQREAELWLSKQKVRRQDVSDAAASGLPPPPEPVKRELLLFKSYADRWYESRKPDLAHSTRIRYEQNIAMITAGPLGAIPVEALSYRDVEAWLTHLADETVKGEGGKREPRFGYYALRQILDLLRRITKRMRVEHDLANWACETVEIPKRARRRKGTKREALTRDELVAFLTAIEAPYYRKRNWRGIFWLLAATGCRPCEALALRREHISIDTGEIHIRSSAYNGVIKESTKTGDSRTPAITGQLRAVLLEQLARVPKKPGALLFASAEGGPHWESTLKKPFTKALKAAGIERTGLTVYSLRNTANTLAHASGADHVTVLDLIGHSESSVNRRYRNTSLAERAAVQESIIPVAIGCHSQPVN